MGTSHLPTYLHLAGGVPGIRGGMIPASCRLGGKTFFFNLNYSSVSSRLVLWEGERVVPFRQRAPTPLSLVSPFNALLLPFFLILFLAVRLHPQSKRVAVGAAGLTHNAGSLLERHLSHLLGQL